MAGRATDINAQHQPKTKKNIETDLIGDKVGRIHLGKQDLGQLQTRKMKGLKRGRGESDEDQAELEVEGVNGSGKKSKA
jgi:ribosome production factor 2